MDEQRLMNFVGKAVGDIGTLLNGALVVIGDRLGLYRAMADGQSITPAQLAEKTGTTTRYLHEWLNAQVGGGYVTYEGNGHYSLPAEYAVALTDESSPACVIGGYELALAAVHSTDRLTEAFRTGAGIGWGEHHEDLYPGCERFFGPSYRNFIGSEWIPSLNGVDAALNAGASVADIGCGLGVSTVAMAKSYPAATFVGFDQHDASVELARVRASEAGLADRVSFEVGTARDFPGGYDLITVCDALHDMGDPAGAAAHARQALRPGGTLMVVEPLAGDSIEQNQNPVSTAYYAFSNFLCTPSSLSQEGAMALGAQAGEARLTAILHGAGFSSVRRAAETSLNMVLEAKV
ncbi:class I SAM-dependent methyltransferase [Glaciibacter superstes]|uniref:class I SAM-dependent methyltransferase n=1 Tax=Glaciibacter superstes TaxID=501023 RepID=UPI0003B48A5F|nr:class I SAM-dependent methyltransferase [Glaciibacter superstes]